MPKRSTALVSGKRIPIIARVTPDLRAALEQASEAFGRTLSHEIEHRLEMSVLDHDLMRVVREQIRQEMRAEFEARRDAPVLSLSPEMTEVLRNANREPGSITWLPDGVRF